MIAAHGKSKVTVERDRLLKIVMENRENHRNKFSAAWNGYVEHVEKELQKAKRVLTKSRAENDAPAFLQAGHITWDVPRDQTKDYDRVIRMLELSVETEVELDETGFSNYVLDEWSWSRKFRHDCSNYTQGLN